MFLEVSTHLFLFSAHKSVSKAEVIFFIYFPQISHTIHSILTSKYSQQASEVWLRKWLLGSWAHCEPKKEAKFSKKGTYFVGNFLGNIFRGGHAFRDHSPFKLWIRYSCQMDLNEIDWYNKLSVILLYVLLLCKIHTFVTQSHGTKVFAENAQTLLFL